MKKIKIHKKCFYCIDCGRNCRITYVGAKPRFCPMCGSRLKEIKSIKKKDNLLIVKYE
jgi:Zn finger protein HypA/HybF involved in hydrogenase expression